MLLLFLLSAQPAQQPSSILARVNDEVITVDDLEAELRRQGFPPGTEDPGARRRVLQNMVRQKMILQEAARLKITVEEREVDSEIERHVRTLASRGREYDEWLRTLNLTHAQHRKRLEFEILKEKVFYTKMDRWIEEPGEQHPVIHQFITPEEIRRYYNDHRNEFESRERAKLLRLTLLYSTPEQKAEKERLARSVLRRVAAGAHFEIEAQLSSDVRNILIKDYDRTSPLFGEAIKNLIFDETALPEHQVSGILEEPGALHLLMVIQRQKARIQTFEEVQHQIRLDLELQRRRANEELLLKDLIRNTYLEPKDILDGAK